jgi:three-Cys-motif partner protein
MDEKQLDHSFGGEWTSTKLDILRRYLEAYLKVMKKQPFETWYIDAFAGTGYRTCKPKDSMASTVPLLPDLATEEPQGFLSGSARIALELPDKFSRYIFIEKNMEHADALQLLKTEFSPISHRIDIVEGDANVRILELCKVSWGNRRAVLFLDPYGMDVKWTTIEAIARTEAIDLWLLFPWGIGLNRLLSKSGDIPEEWRRKIDEFLGTADWYDAFYRVETHRNLFGEDQQVTAKKKIDEVIPYFIQRLQLLFGEGVAEKPKLLVNSRNCPLYLFFFACANPRGREIALKIAKHILTKI